ncbi:MAG: hypothetical protein P8014_19745 [Acidihalobacter sp.]|uniref:hypothetical protein n=1 Tax=Acidihalobacter sp. TaxID=1872108 RepID=UPI00307F238C
MSWHHAGYGAWHHGYAGGIGHMIVSSIVHGVVYDVIWKAMRGLDLAGSAIFQLSGPGFTQTQPSAFS